MNVTHYDAIECHLNLVGRFVFPVFLGYNMLESFLLGLDVIGSFLRLLRRLCALN
jgi:hypothetical protein